MCVGTFDLASVSPSLRSVSNNLRRDTPIVSANLRRNTPLIARRAGYDCAPLHVRQPNNGCERALRPSVVFRKVTGGFRSQWDADLYASTVSVIATARLHGRSALQAIRDALAGRPILLPP